MTRDEQIIDSYVEPPEIKEHVSEDDLLAYYEDKNEV